MIDRRRPTNDGTETEREWKREKRERERENTRQPSVLILIENASMKVQRVHRAPLQTVERCARG